MIHFLEDYICRSIDPAQFFVTNPNLMKKVDTDGSFLPFIGNTVVYDLEHDTKCRLTLLQEALYQAAGDLLSQPLIPSTFHMTLHDLINGNAGEDHIHDRMAQIAPQVKSILSQWKDHPPIHMQATWMFNMVNTSIVLGLKPSDPDSYTRLDEMYCCLENVVPLGYPLCPHITLAYFRPGKYCPEQMGQLCSGLKPVEMDVVLRSETLKLQNFDHMNCYYCP